MRLYVWEDFARDYTAGIAVAVAHDGEEARALIMGVMGDWVSGYLRAPPDVYELDEPRGFAVSGGG